VQFVASEKQAPQLQLLFIDTDITRIRLAGMVEEKSGHDRTWSRRQLDLLVSRTGQHPRQWRRAFL
jgi:hypothetical protein